MKGRYKNWEDYYSPCRSVHNKVRKDYLANKCIINCGFCRYHRGENFSFNGNSWKKHRKTQYKTKGKAVWQSPVRTWFDKMNELIKEEL